ncbi:riboflavine-aldehyde-forming enzyme [Xylariaceae sp. FL1651]|nr:riboflavine-aldehyde-forming enzyme [Xylariaceae sp. FL1651]
MSPLTKIIVALSLIAGPAAAFSGDMIWFNPGLGSCGQTNSDNDPIVALSPSQQSGNCGKSIKIQYQDKTATAQVVDTCAGCGSGSIDVSPSVFKQLANLDQGRVGVTWELI